MLLGFMGSEVRDYSLGGKGFGLGQLGVEKVSWICATM